MKNKILVSMLVAILTILSAFSFAADAVRVQMDGKILDFTDENGVVVNPQIVNSRTMVPMRKIFETYGANVAWDDDTKTVTATAGDKQITLTINLEVAKVKDLVAGTEESITLDSAPVIIGSRTMVPLRFISESLNKTVGWDDDEKTAIIIDFDKLAEVYKEKLPVIQKLIDLKLEEMHSYKSKSDVNAELVYTDLEDDSENETIKATGVINLDVNQKEDMNCDFDINVSGGEGDIMNAIVDGGLEHVNLTAILKDGKFLLGMKEADGYVWTDKTEEIEGYGSGMINVGAIGGNTLDKMISNVDDYQDVLDFVKGYIGDLNINTYDTLVSVADLVATILDGDAMNIVDLGEGKQQFVLKLDFMKVLGKLVPLTGVELPEANVSFELKANIVGNRIDSEEASIHFEYTNEESLEAIGCTINLNTTYSEVNQDFEINAPEL